MSEAKRRIETLAYGGVRPSLEELLAADDPFIAYTYSYPHKTAYRPLTTRRPLAELWAAERTDALFLYFHVPFCESRCGYCNLFSHACHDSELATRYLAALERQAAIVEDALGDHRFARVAIGGGTPTSLPLPQLVQLFDIAERGLGASLRDLPVSLETSPATATADKLAAAAERGVDRVSIGVQSFDDGELEKLYRSQGSELAGAALDRLRAAGFSTLNIDLIYGIAGQTVVSWCQTLETALRWQPEELYLYPLYVRPLTGLGRAEEPWRENRLELYRAGRDLLTAAGYEQLSLRMFRRRDAGASEGPIYCCQEDGMIGLGCGARSYTRGLHYSDEWAVGAKGVRTILESWVARPERDFVDAWYGFDLDDEDQRVRYILKSLFRNEGLDLTAYRGHVGGDALVDQPELADLVRLDLAVRRDDRLLLTARGMELSDCLSPWLYSARVRERMGEFELR